MVICNASKSMMVMMLIVISVGFINSCKKEDQDTDTALFELAKKSDGFVWYRKSDIALNKSAGSGHTQPFLRTRYNAIATTKLDATGKIISGATFPEGALIVKELMANSTTIERYAILLKKTASKNADSKGWVWGYMNADGKVIESVTKKGSACINCHTQSGHIDYMLMNKYFP